MKKHLPTIVISTLITGVVLYFVFNKQDAGTQEEVWYNVVGGMAGMLIGMILYYRFVHKEEE